MNLSVANAFLVTAKIKVCPFLFNNSSCYRSLAIEIRSTNVFSLNLGNHQVMLTDGTEVRAQKVLSNATPAVTFLVG